ncbi:hypothetical protein D9M72_534840 [compost metagenome]
MEETDVLMAPALHLGEHPSASIAEGVQCPRPCQDIWVCKLFDSKLKHREVANAGRQLIPVNGAADVDDESCFGAGRLWVWHAEGKRGCPGRFRPFPVAGAPVLLINIDGDLVTQLSPKIDQER